MKGVMATPMKRLMRAREAVEVYVGKDGHVCMKQTDHYNDDAIICLEPEQVETVIRWLGECAAEAEEQFSQLIEEEEAGDEATRH